MAPAGRRFGPRPRESRAGRASPRRWLIRWQTADLAQHAGPGGFLGELASIGVLLQGKIQDLILKDMLSARDEATPPAFKELVERYYEVLSKNGGSP